QELREQNRHLEARVEERTKALGERTVELEEALGKLEATQKTLIQQERFRAFSEVAGGVAHDFNNVLNCVIGYTGLMLGDPKIVGNAVDAMPRSGTITLLTSATNGTVSFGVRDAGTGMSEGVRQRCLEPFYTTKGENGTGLGLAMVFGIAKRHDGSIDIDSQG